MSVVDEFLKIMKIPEDEALAALLSAFGPPQPGAVSGAWRKNAHYGNSAPASELLWNLLETADFRCNECRSTLRLTFDHIDKNATNHARENLRVLCFTCNRKRVGSSSTDLDDARPIVLLYKAAMALLRETGEIPRNVDI